MLRGRRRRGGDPETQNDGRRGEHFSVHYTEEGEWEGEIVVGIGDISDSRLCADDTVRNGCHSDVLLDSIMSMAVFLSINDVLYTNQLII